MPRMYIIAGPNGAGKTTAAYSLLPDVFTTVEFVNADEIFNINLYTSIKNYGK
jgi:predicted ABC-type ATPase